ncbi:hypothetical protein [Microbulbifer magnicolonia]|uniref:hypothetical protein n=1 Tax=Microbulbifer magnicolonia TaxID=3109744 RepID=UPI002B405FB3|nr:hypothetical protein [Microbulbifer sp. GG15]
MSESVELTQPRFEASIYFDDKLLEQRCGDDPQALEIWMHALAGEGGNYNGKIIDHHAGGVQVKAFRYSAPDS